MIENIVARRNFVRYCDNNIMDNIDIDNIYENIVPRKFEFIFIKKLLFWLFVSIRLLKKNLEIQKIKILK